jgi:integrase
MTTNEQQALAAGASATSRAENRSIAFRHLADAYMAAYAGRDDRALPTRVAFWIARFGEQLAHQITDDDVHAALEELAAGEALTYRGKDADGRPIYAGRGRRSPATINRYHAALGAIFKHARKKRLVPKGWEPPTRQIERQTENNARVRFLSADERNRLLAVCRASSWPKLYLLVLMALTTAARRSELLGLRWGDVDRDKAIAYVSRTKNGEPRMLVLVPGVLEELRKFSGPPEALVFGSERRRGQPMNFESCWRIALREARIPNFRFHDLRHSCASLLAQQGASLVELADVLGHKTMAMVKRYSHLSTESKARLVNRVFGEIR